MTDHEELKAFIDGELSVEAADRVREAIDRDPAIRAEVERMRVIGEMLRREVKSIPVMGREEALAMFAKRRRRPWYASLWFGGLSTAAVSAGLLFAWNSTRSTSSVASVLAPSFDQVAAASPRSPSGSVVEDAQLKSPSVLESAGSAAKPAEKPVEKSVNKQSSVVRLKSSTGGTAAAEPKSTRSLAKPSVEVSPAPTASGPNPVASPPSKVSTSDSATSTPKSLAGGFGSLKAKRPEPIPDLSLAFEASKDDVEKQVRALVTGKNGQVLFEVDTAGVHEIWVRIDKAESQALLDGLSKVALPSRISGSTERDQAAFDRSKMESTNEKPQTGFVGGGGETKSKADVGQRRTAGAAGAFGRGGASANPDSTVLIRVQIKRKAPPKGPDKFE